MKQTSIAALTLFLVLGAISPADAQQSRSGPVPPPGTDRGLIEPTRAQVVISGVPTYIWHHGCGPTAVGMVIGYWDGQGVTNLVPGDASTQTAAANAMMTNDDGFAACGGPQSNHFQDYSCPQDYSPSPIQADRSETGGAHTDDCVGDFMYTSQSAYSNYYGWSWMSHIPRSFTEYVDLVSPGMDPQATNHYYGTGLWDEYIAEIDAGRPVVLLVDSDGNGGTDHFVTGVGYNDVTMQYAIYDTWDHGIHWYNWHGMLYGSPWGIYAFTKFSLSLGLEIESILPYQNQLHIPKTTDITITFNLELDNSTFDDTTFFVRGSLSGRHYGQFDYNRAAQIVVFNPDEDFVAGEVVTVTITDGVQSSGSAYSLNPTGWSFTIATTGGGVFVLDDKYATPYYPRAICAADFTNDGVIDLATVAIDYLSIHPGLGDGTFAARIDIDLEGIYGYELYPADLDGDDDIDLVMSCQTTEYQGFIGIYMNNGDGTFASASSYLTTGYTGPIVAADLNGDGTLDLAKANGWTHDVSVYFNYGNGTFADEVTYPSDGASFAVCAADLENDYDFDLGVTTDGIVTLANAGNGTFADGVFHTYAWNGFDLCAADFNADGYADLANAAEDGEYMGYVHVLLNNQDGSFDLDEAHFVGGSALSLAVGDLDGDGDVDLSIGSEVDEVYLLTNDGNGSFTKPDDFPPSAYPQAIFAADFNGDGTFDIARVNSSADSMLVFLNFDYLCGDANSDENINVGDPVYLINYVFKSGPPPVPLEAGDANCDDAVNVGDAVYLINYVFKSGAEPCCPD